MTDHAAIEIENLSLRFDGRSVVEDFSLTVRAGEKVLLMGPSGSGKSTLLLCLLGLAEPETGAIRIEGEPLDPHSAWSLRRRMAWVSQEPELGGGTAREALERPFQYRANADLKENLERLPSLMEQFRLPEWVLDKEMSTLSGGEKQRIALISALLLARPIILLDEVSSALDAESKQAVMTFLRAAEGQTVLCVSHDREWASTVDRVVQLTSNGGAP